MGAVSGTLSGGTHAEYPRRHPALRDRARKPVARTGVHGSENDSGSDYST